MFAVIGRVAKLPKLLASPEVYVAVTVPEEVGEKKTPQEMGGTTQEPAENEPVPLKVHVMPPVGEYPLLMVAEHVVLLPTTTTWLEQLKDKVVI
jgi:hypothetical protein